MCTNTGGAPRVHSPDSGNYERVWRALSEARDYLIGPGSLHDRLDHAWGRCSAIQLLVQTGCAAPDWLITEIEELRQRSNNLDIEHSRVKVLVSTLSHEECTEAAQQILNWCDRLRDGMNERAG